MNSMVEGGVDALAESPLVLLGDAVTASSSKSSSSRRKSRIKTKNLLASSEPEA